MRTPSEALESAIQAAGSTVKLAALLGLKSRGVVNGWRTVQRVPAAHCPAIERATGGAVRCEELRPDVAWDVLRSAPPVEQPVGAEPAKEGA